MPSLKPGSVIRAPNQECQKKEKEKTLWTTRYDNFILTKSWISQVLVTPSKSNWLPNLRCRKKGTHTPGGGPP